MGNLLLIKFRLHQDIAYQWEFWFYHCPDTYNVFIDISRVRIFPEALSIDFLDLGIDGLSRANNIPCQLMGLNLIPMKIVKDLCNLFAIRLLYSFKRPDMIMLQHELTIAVKASR